MGRLSTTIVGTSFRGQDAKNIVARLKGGEKLRAVREPTNKYDPFAVAVYFSATHIGYLARAIARDMTSLMDNGVAVTITKLRGAPGTGFIEVTWDDEQAANATKEALAQSATARPAGAVTRLTPPKKPTPVAPTRPKFPEIDLDGAVDTRPDPWE